MEDFDALVPHFCLAKDRWPQAPTLQNHYKAVKESYEGSAHGLIATVKSFIESLCLTVLGEFGKTMPSSEPSTTELLVEALRVLGLQNSRGASKLDKLLSAHNKLADALNEMRNENDPVAHGKDGFLDALTLNERRAFLLTADTILALILRAHDGKEPDLQYTREPYDRFQHLHERLDGAVTVESAIENEEDSQEIVITLRTGNLPDGIQLRIEPSRLLYAIDRTAYVELLTSSAVPPAIITPAADVSAKAPPELRRAPEPESPVAEVVLSYQGFLSTLKESFDRYLDSLGLGPSVYPASGMNLRDSLLATAERSMGLDWAKREPLMAAMKVALRKTLRQFGIDSRRAEEGAEHLVSWFKIQAVGLEHAEAS
jgi:Abortive infection C-terminus